MSVRVDHGVTVAKGEEEHMWETMQSFQEPVLWLNAEDFLSSPAT